VEVAGRLELTRSQILGYRRSVGALDRRLPPGGGSLHRAAWAGLQDSMPRAALLSIHGRVEGTDASTWEDPSLVQLWGPRFNVFVVAARDLAVFSLGTLSDDGNRRRRAEDLAARLHSFLEGARMSYWEAGRALGVHPNSLRYAAATGTVLIRWEGARRPTVWTVPAPAVDPREARLELARRYLHIYGPTTPEAFAWWAGIRPRHGLAAFQALGGSLTPVHTPVSATRGSSAATSRPSAPRRDLWRPHGCYPVATPICCCREPIGSSWSPTPTAVARCGPRACGPVACWWMERSSAGGGAPTRR
jgi:hypothetical protein